MQQERNGLCAIFFVLVFCMVGMSTLLGLQILYSTHHLNLNDHQASLLFSASISSMFLMPAVGSFIAHKWLNTIVTVSIGLLLSITGLYVMCLSASGYYYAGLASFITGNGCVISNLIGLLSRLYNKSDQRRDGIFLLCFIGMNAGSFFALVGLTLVAINCGYHFAFLTCACLYVIALIVFIASSHDWQIDGNKKNNKTLKEINITDLVKTAVLLSISIAVIGEFLHYAKDHTYSVAAIALAATIMIIATSRQLLQISKRALLMALFIMVISIIFWAFFLLAPSLVTLFIERTQHHTLLGITLPSSAFFALNPLFVIILGLIYLAGLKLTRQQRSLQCWSALPFLSGLGCLSLAYLILSIAYHSSLHCLIQVVAFYALLSIAEILILPLGVAAMSRLLPQGKEGLLTGIWFLSISIGSIISGLITHLTLHATDTNLPHTLSTNYPLHFLHFSLIIAILAGILTVTYYLSEQLTSSRAQASSSSS